MQTINRKFQSKAHEQAFHSGYESKMAEINGMGWEASRDKFNLDYLPGMPWVGSPLGLEFSKGEFAALEDNK